MGLSSGFSYDESGNLKSKGEWTLQYNGSKPHAVSTAFKAGEAKQYEYDNNGSVTTIRNGSGGIISELTYTTFDKVTEVITEGEITQIFYNAGRNRYIRKDNVQSTHAEKVTHYLGSVEYTYQNGQVKIKRHLGNLIIDIIDHENRRNQWTYHYLLKDHLDSTHTIVNKQGYHTNRFSFNAWGERRQPPMPNIGDTIYQEYTSVWAELGPQIEATTNRGFTGHEHFDKAGFIHMNGRIYDPTIGRFLQADPVIQDPYNTQSLNRYSYVMNNPLSYTDPSGYSRLRKGWWRVPVSIAAMFIPIPGNAYLAAFIRGALSRGIATDSLKGTVHGGIMATVTFGIAHGSGGEGWVKTDAGRMVAHGVVAGVSAEVDGGKFGHGFASSYLASGADRIGLTNFSNIFARVIANALVAGTISEMTGGKFANGAMSAAFRVAFNEWAEGEVTSGAKEDPDWFYGKRINGKMVDRYGDTGGGDMILNKDGYWQSSDGAAQEVAFGERYNTDSDLSLNIGGSYTQFIGVTGFSTTIFPISDMDNCAFVVECSMYGIGYAATVSSVYKGSAVSSDSMKLGKSNGVFIMGSVLSGAKGSFTIGSGNNHSASASFSHSAGWSAALGFKSCTTSYSNAGCN